MEAVDTLLVGLIYGYRMCIWMGAPSAALPWRYEPQSDVQAHGVLTWQVHAAS